MFDSKKKYYFSVISCMIVATGVFAQPVEEGKKIFQAKCAACHTIGKGNLSGPDLKDISKKREKKWITGFIQDPGEYLKSDKIGKQLLAEFKIPMPDLGITPKEADSIVSYIDFASGGAVANDEKDSESAVSLGNAEVGKDLFIGRVGLENGGASCVSCHSVTGIGVLGGGTLGPDLTLVSKRYGAGLGQTLKTMPFPTMKGIYDNKPLVQSEVNDLYAFFTKSASLDVEKFHTTFLFYGFGGFVLLMIIFVLAWRNRLGDVRKKLVEGDAK